MNISKSKILKMIRASLIKEATTSLSKGGEYASATTSFSSDSLFSQSFSDPNIVTGEEGIPSGDISTTGDSTKLDPKVQAFSNAFQKKYPDIKITGKGRSPYKQGVVSFKWPYAIDVMIRKKDSSIPPGSYYLTAEFEKNKAKVNAALKSIGKKAVSSGVYGNGAKQMFDIYEKYKDKIKGTGKTATDAATENAVGRATEALWAKTAKPGTHLTRQAIDVVGLPLNSTEHAKLKNKFNDFKKSNKDYSNYKIYVKREADHYHIGITPG